MATLLDVRDAIQDAAKEMTDLLATTEPDSRDRHRVLRKHFPGAGAGEIDAVIVASPLAYRGVALTAQGALRTYLGACVDHAESDELPKEGAILEGALQALEAIHGSQTGDQIVQHGRDAVGTDAGEVGGGAEKTDQEEAEEKTST